MPGVGSPRSPLSVKELYEDLSAELWQVQGASGYVKLMSIDEIDTAYKNDALGPDTRLRRSGTLAWKTLGEILGDEPAEVDSLMPFAVAPRDASMTLPPPMPTLRELPWFPVVSDPPQPPLTIAELASVHPRTARKLVSPVLVLAAAFAFMFVATSVALKTVYAPQPAAAAAAPPPAPVSPLPPPLPTAEPAATSDDTYIESSAVLVLVQPKKAKAAGASKARAAAKAPELPPNPFAAAKR
jgi:hypothetical protein